jgi:hypothetical protein
VAKLIKDGAVPVSLVFSAVIGHVANNVFEHSSVIGAIRKFIDEEES